MVEAEYEQGDDSDALERSAERDAINFLAALNDELMRTLMVSGVLTQVQLNEIEQAVARKMGNVPRAW